MADVINHHKPGDLKQYKCILSQFWSLEFQNQGASWVTFPPDNFFLASSGFGWLWVFLPLRPPEFNLSLHFSQGLPFHVCI